MRYWKKLQQEQINSRIFDALDQNVDFRDRLVLGVPASHLDERVFTHNQSLLKEAPFLSTLVQNPNHIGCHTLGDSTSFFSGTQAIEKELIQLCAEDILYGQEDAQDGYVASGGTEANIQAMWIFRNYFMQVHHATIDEISIVCSEDTHYSIFKAANLLTLEIISVPVDPSSRKLDEHELRAQLRSAKRRGVRFIQVVANMMTTMFGSVDDIDLYVKVLESEELDFRIHVDGAFGGFIYPFSHKDNKLNFSNPYVTSVTLDAHKMVEAPYGTGIFIIRKGYMAYVNTSEARYVEGPEATLTGSRSGANAVSVWMILMTYGPNGWHEKIHILNYRTSWFCKALDKAGISYFRQSGSNIVSIRASEISKETADKFGLVPDVHTADPAWYKVVIMSHVTVDVLAELIDEIQSKNQPAEILETHCL